MKVSNLIMVSAAVLALGIGGLHLFDWIRTGAPAKTAAAAPEQLPSSEPLPEQPPIPEVSGPGATTMPMQPEQLAAEIERALVSADPQQRETAFSSLLPQLLQEQPGSVVAMVARQAPGE